MSTPLPPVPSVLRIATQFTVGPDTNVASRHFTHFSGAAPSASEIQTFASQVYASWVTEFITLLQSGYHIDKLTVHDLTSDTTPIGEHVETTSGSRTGHANPAQVAVVVRHPITRRYRGGHPRSYLPLLQEEDLANAGTWASTPATDVETAWNNWMNDINTAVWSGGGILTQVNVSYRSGFTNVLYPSGRYHAVPTLRSTPLVDLCSTSNVNLKVGTQRRRTLQSS